VSRRKVAPPLTPWINDAAATDKRPRTENAIASDLRVIADQSAKFSKPRGNWPLRRWNRDHAFIQTDIGKNDARAQVRSMAQNGIAYIIEMRDLGIVKNQAVFEFRGISSHNAITHDDIFPNVATIADLAVLTDPSWPFDHRPLLDDGVFSNKYRSTDERLADQSSMESWLEAKLKVAGNFRQHIPRMLDIIK